MNQVQQQVNFVVYESGKKAQYPDFKVDPSWKSASFPTLTKARAYTRKWLGVWGISIPRGWDGSKLNYSGYGDTIEIRHE